MVGGTVTFLFTDIEGSTRRWERDRDAMAAALRRHDELIRGAIVSEEGVVFKTIGDAFCAVFATAPSALAAAARAQRALGAEDFSAAGGAAVRMALHTGTAEQRDGDYFGPAVNRVARLLAIGHGGQVLLSAATAELLRGEMPPQSTLRDLGEHRLKDLARAERVFQLAAPGLRADFPALRSLDELPNNLPLQLTSFVGREQDVAELKTLVRDSRLVTIVGSGGAGKTRCAIQTAAELLDAFDGGVWLVELASVSDPSLVAATVAQTLGVRELPNAAPIDTLLAYLKQRRLLLVLDNCEHLIDEVRRVVTAIARACPEVRVLATSRESLNIAGERVFRLPSLTVPPEREAVGAGAALEYGAVALFADRALASDGRFALTDQNAPFVNEISRRLDGIPLAIELAAARIKVLSPQQLAQKLDERFRVLTGGDRSALPRHQTMRALIDWSYDLLSEAERALFRKLSIFAGGFTLESASAVCGDASLDEIGVLELLTSLVDKSLVQSEPSDETTRYRLLESTRRYACERQNELGEYDAAARAHANAFLTLAERLERAYDKMPDRRWFAEAEPEIENWRAALEWALAEGGDVLLGQRLAVALSRVWAFLSATEGLRWIRSARERIGAATPSPVVARLELAESQLDGALGLHKASYDAAERALTLFKALGDALGVAQAQRHSGRSLVFLQHVPEGEALLHEALAAFRMLGADTLAGAALENLAIARNALGDVDGARAFYSEALAIFIAHGADRLARAVASNLAEAEFRAGNAEAALRLAGEALAADRAANFRYRVAFRLCNMAAYFVAIDRFDEAKSHARGALLLARSLNYESALALALQHLAAVAAFRSSSDPQLVYGNRERAARMLAYVDARLRSMEALREYTERQEHDRMNAVLAATFDSEERARLAAQGCAFREEQAVAEALLIE